MNDHLHIFLDNAYEIAYTAPVAVVKQRKRGMTKDTKDDLLIMTMIKHGKSKTAIAEARTSHQKELFASFEQGKQMMVLLLISGHLCLGLTKISTKQSVVFSCQNCGYHLYQHYWTNV